MEEEKRLERIPLKKIGKSEDLLDKGSKLITAIVIPVDDVFRAFSLIYN